VNPACRYLRRNDEQCTAEAVDPEADVLICVKHLARAVKLFEDRLREQMERLT
jgi:hypothetical protein